MVDSLIDAIATERDVTNQEKNRSVDKRLVDQHPISGLLPSSTRAHG